MKIVKTQPRITSEEHKLEHFDKVSGMSDQATFIGGTGCRRGCGIRVES